MTTPTQAQIDAAAQAIFMRRFKNIAMPYWDCKADAEAALTTAAQVGECVPSTFLPPEKFKLAAPAQVGEQKEWPKEFWDEFLRLRKKDEIDATIERCAQVAEDYVRIAGAMPTSVIDTVCRDIAAAIRELKDAPPSKEPPLGMPFPEEEP